MKTIFNISILFILIVEIYAQTQLNIQGNSLSTDTVVIIKVNYGGNEDVVGLSVHSDPGGFETGTGGYFYGGDHGIVGEAFWSNGVFGKSTNGSGVKGESINSTGVRGTSEDSYGVRGKSTNGIAISGISVEDYGVEGTSTNGGGVKGHSNSSTGVFGESSDGLGVRGKSTNSQGVYGFSENSSGVRGKSTNGYGLNGFSSSATGVRGYGVTYDFDAQGPGINYGTTSSQRWKNNIINIPEPLIKLERLRGVYFDWDEMHGGKHDIGFIAEEIGQVLPEIVLYEENGIDARGMDYSMMTPLLVEAVNAMRREYQEKFEKQQSEIDQLRNKIEKLEKLLLTQTNRSNSDE